MSQILQTVYASAPADQIIIHTLELVHPAFNVDGFPPGFIRLAQCYGDKNYDDLLLGLENGQSAIFKPSGFGVSLPKRSLRGQQDLNFQLDNVTGDALRAIDDAEEAGGKIEVFYRSYLCSDYSQPAEPAIKMIAASCRADFRSVTVSASFHDLTNKAWPSRRYTPEFAPGLKYFG